MPMGILVWLKATVRIQFHVSTTSWRQIPSFVRDNNSNLSAGLLLHLTCSNALLLRPTNQSLKEVCTSPVEERKHLDWQRKVSLN